MRFNLLNNILSHTIKSFHFYMGEIVLKDNLAL